MQAEEVLRMLEGRVESLTAKYDKLRLECDGLTRVLNYVLMDNKIKHTVYTGHVDYKGGKNHIPMHFWIELGDGRVVDYRLRMWLGKKRDVPHGVFKPSDYPDVQYKNKKKIPMATDRKMFDLLFITGA